MTSQHALCIQQHLAPEHEFQTDAAAAAADGVTPTQEAGSPIAGTHALHISLLCHAWQWLCLTCLDGHIRRLLAGMLGYVVLLEHLRRLMYLYHVFTILQTVSIVLLMVTFWRKW